MLVSTDPVTESLRVCQVVYVIASLVALRCSSQLFVLAFSSRTHALAILNYMTWFTAE